jgi:hypothetical protein
MTSGFNVEVFDYVDSADSVGFSKLFSPEGRLRFANGEPMVGRDAIEAGCRGFFSTIKGMHHTVVREWVSGADAIAELSVGYDRLDGGSVTIPVVSIWHRGDDGLIDDYRVYFDLAPVFAPA